MLLYRTKDGLISSERPGGPLVALPGHSLDDVFTSVVRKPELELRFPQRNRRSWLMHFPIK